MKVKSHNFHRFQNSFLETDYQIFVIFQVVELDLTTIVPSLSGPKRPHDRVAVENMKSDFIDCLSSKVREFFIYL